MMKLLQPNYVLATVLLSSTLAFSFSASAQEASLERSLAATVQVQGQQMIKDLSTNLSHSIKQELQQFSTRYARKSVATATTTKVAKTNQQKKLTSAE
jgi:hypothetical protein